MRRLYFLFAAWVFALLFLSGCAGALHYQRADSQEVMEWVQGFDPDDPVAFAPAGIVAAGDRLFIFGSFETTAFSVRTFVLVSENGGKKWVEVARPVPCSKIISMRFPDEQHGYGLSAWTMEGPGKLHLIRTADGGATWERMPDIPKDHYSGWPTAFDFFSNTRGEVNLQFMDDNPENLRPVMITDDAGQSWQAFFEDKAEISDAPQPLAVLSAKNPKGEAFTLSLSDKTWNLVKASPGAPEKELIFSFPTQSPVKEITALESEDCGCPKKYPKPDLY